MYSASTAGAHGAVRHPVSSVTLSRTGRPMGLPGAAADAFDLTCTGWRLWYC